MATRLLFLQTGLVVLSADVTEYAALHFLPLPFLGPDVQSKRGKRVRGEVGRLCSLSYLARLSFLFYASLVPCSIPNHAITFIF